MDARQCRGKLWVCARRNGIHRVRMHRRASPNGVAAENRASSLDAHAIENGSSSETRKETDAFFAKGDA